MATTQPHTDTDADAPGSTPEYVLGPVHGNTQPYATYETKQSAEYADGRTGSGGGYTRWRSWEYRPETPGEDKEDVYVAVHRLHYLTHPDLDGVSLDEALRELAGCDIHHTNGCRFDNRHENYELLSHAEHSSRTQAEIRAYGEDAKEAAHTPPGEEPTWCPGCHEEIETPCRSDGYDGVRCLECAKRDCNGCRIHLG